VTAVEWHDVGRADDASEGDLRRVEADGRAVCVGRTAAGWVAFDDTCTHEECSLADGELDGGVIVCPCHGSEFDVRTGDVLTPPALDPLPIYEAREEGGALLVRLGPPPLAEAAVHAREDHVPETAAREATVPGPSLDDLVLDDIDLTDLDVWEERVPYDWLALLRRDAPLHWQPEQDGRGFWALTRYDDVLGRQILQRRAPELGRERLPVLRHREDVVVARQRPEPASVLLRLPVQRRVPAEEREPVVRHPLLPDVEVGEVDVVDNQVVERGAGHGRLTGDGLRNVVLPRVQRLRSDRRRRETDLHCAALLSRLVDRQRVERRRREDVAGAHVELRAVARADDDAVVQLALSERALLVGARVVERDPAR